MRTKPTADFEMSAKRRIALTNDVKLRHAKPFQDRSLQNKEHTIENENKPLQMMKNLAERKEHQSKFINSI